jgi:hypothetical protein
VLRGWRRRRIVQLEFIWGQLLVTHTNKRDGFPKGIWRRRPDLNRGWRFCRFR